MRSALEMVMQLVRLNELTKEQYRTMRMVAESHLQTPSETTQAALFSNEEIVKVLGANDPPAQAPAAAPAQE